MFPYYLCPAALTFRPDFLKILRNVSGLLTHTSVLLWKLAFRGKAVKGRRGPFLFFCFSLEKFGPFLNPGLLKDTVVRYQSIYQGQGCVPWKETSGGQRGCLPRARPSPRATGLTQHL